MKTIEKDELFQSLSEFLKAKGIELKEGAYAQRIRQACNLLGDTVNATQKTARKAKDELDKNLARLRESLREKKAPRPSPAAASDPAPSRAPKAAKPRSSGKRRAAPVKRPRTRGSAKA
jgi:hypothetical protein